MAITIHNKLPVSIFWFRRDLRLEDNCGLSQALKGDRPVLCVFIFDPEILLKIDNHNDPRITFIHRTLLNIKKKLEAKGSSLLILNDKPLLAFKKLTEKYNIKQVFTNNDYEPSAMDRDAKIQNFLNKKNISFHSFKDQCIFEKNEVLRPNRDPYTMFTPYSKTWLAKLKDSDLKPFKNKNNFFKTNPFKTLHLKDLNFSESKMKLLKPKLDIETIKNYHLNRDIPALNGTTKLGLHLRFGTISIRKCVSLALKYNRTWLKELIWREFFMQILWCFPHVQTQAFKKQYDNIQWRKSKKDYRAWCVGQTGYPLVDAGMRELNHTGFMHNRVRMLVASFLTKHLLIDWREGEAYFAEKLLDYELASNNGNWQWCAGTGCDAAPYFRIFNPHIQQKKFDPEFKYIKKWVPEYGTAAYVKPIVDHELARRRTLVAYANALKKIK